MPGDRWPRRALAVAAALTCAILAAAAIDHTVGVSHLPDLPIFTQERPASSIPEVAEEEAIEDGFVKRAGLYGLALVLTASALLVVGVRAAPRERWHELFTDVGVAGVGALGLAVAITLSGPRLLDEASKAPIWTPGSFLVVVAGLGSLLSRGWATREGPAASAAADSPGSRPVTRSRAGRALEAGRIGWTAAGLALLSGGLLAIAGTGGVDCGQQAPTWQGIALIAALVPGLAVGACGVIALLARRWIVALVAIPFPVIALFLAFAGAGGGCLA